MPIGDSKIMMLIFNLIYIYIYVNVIDLNHSYMILHRTSVVLGGLLWQVG